MSIISPETLIPPSSDHKKLYMIIAVVVFGIVVLIPLLLGIFTPTSSKKTTTNAVQTTSTPPSQITQAVPSVAVRTKSLNPTPATNQQTVQQYAPTPEPTLNFDALLPTKIVTPTPTPLPGPFYIANGKQNDLSIRLYTPDITYETYEVQLINNRTHEVRLMGYTYLDSPGDSAFFSNNYSEVIFLGGKKTNTQVISFYSIPNRNVVKSITLDDMKNTIPNLPLQPTAILSNMIVSPDGKRVAVSYGNTFSEKIIDSNTVIMIINLSTKKMQLLSVKGLTKDWKDNNTLEYQTNSSDPNTNTVQSVAVSSF